MSADLPPADPPTPEAIRSLFKKDGGVKKDALGEAASKSLFNRSGGKYVKDILNSWPEERQQLFHEVLESLRAEVDGVVTTQLEITAIAYCIIQPALAMDPVMYKNMSKEEREMIEWARKVFDKNYTDIMSNARTKPKENSFLKSLNEFVATRQNAAELEMKNIYASSRLMLPQRKPATESEPEVPPEEEKARLLEQQTRAAEKKPVVAPVDDFLMV